MLIHVQRKYLDQAWPTAEGLLSVAIGCNHGEATLDQVKSQIAYGGADLLLWYEGEACLGAAVIEFVQHPNVRVAHISYIGGRGIVRDDVFAELSNWCRQQGASEIRALCDESHARLFERTGFYEIYRMVKVAL